MAFALTGFKPISFLGSIGNGAGSVRQLFSYVTNDDGATVQANDYFNAVASQVAVGDVIIASLDLDGTVMGRLYIVTAVTATTVTIAKFNYA